VTISDSTVSLHVLGGYIRNGTGTVDSNQVTISDSTVNGFVAGGYIYTGTGTASNNQVTISGSTVSRSVSGGYINIGTGTVDSNQVTISDSTVSHVLGGYTRGGTADSNQVTISDSTVSGNVAGGYLKGGTGTAIYNIVTLRGAVNFNSAGTSELYGGYNEVTGSGVTGNDVFTGNTLYVDNYTGNVGGAGTATLAKIANFEFFNFTIPTSVKDGDTIIKTTTLILGDGTHASQVGSIQYSGATAPGLKEGEVINLIESESALNSLGSPAVAGVDFKSTEVVAKWGSLFEQILVSALEDNKIIVTAADDGGKPAVPSTEPDPVKPSVASDVTAEKSYGIGYMVKHAENEDAIHANGSVTLADGSTTPGDVYGGYAQTDTGKATTTNGSVKLENGSKVTNDVYGGSAQVQAAGDAASTSSVTIKDKSSVTGDVYGSFAFTLRGKATATGTVTVINSKVDSVYGAVAESNSTSIVTGKVTISDSSVASDVYGGYADTLAGTATADNNQVTISDSTLSGKVYGGYIFSDTGTGTANSNTVTLRGAVNFTGTRELYGGYSEVTGKDVFTGNTLKVDNYTGTATFDKIANFEFFNFTIPTSSKDSDAILQTDHLVLGDGADKPSTVGTVQFSGASVPDLKIEDKIILIDSKETVNSSGEKAIDGVDFKGGDLTVKWGSMFEQLFTSSLDGDDIILVAENAGGSSTPGPDVPEDGGIIGGGGGSSGPVKLKDGSRSLAEASFTGFALVNQGADLVAGQAMENATQGAEGFSPFAAVVAGTSRYSAGSDSHTDVSGYSMAAGLAYSAEVNDIIDRITLGAFFEHGAGNYHTGNDFASGHGDTQYTGGGILRQVSFEDTGPGHFYAQAAIRAG